MWYLTLILYKISTKQHNWVFTQSLKLTYKTTFTLKRQRRIELSLYLEFPPPIQCLHTGSNRYQSEILNVTLTFPLQRNWYTENDFNQKESCLNSDGAEDPRRSKCTKMKLLKHSLPSQRTDNRQVTRNNWP